MVKVLYAGKEYEGMLTDQGVLILELGIIVPFKEAA